MKFNLICALAVVSVVFGVEEVHSSLRGIAPTDAALPIVKAKDVSSPAKVAMTETECGSITRPDDFDTRVERGRIFNVLSVEEIDSVVAWMVANSNLGITPYDDANLYSDNYITYVYLAEPEKSQALHYLRTGSNMPGRYATVHVSMAGLATPCMRQYTVGPLPISQSTVLSAPLSFGGITDIPFDARQTSAKEYDHLDALTLEVMSQIDDEMRDSFGTNYYADCPDDFCLTWSDTSPRGPKRDLTMWFAFDVEAFFANPIGFHLTFRMGSLDTSKHKLRLIVYNGQSFDSVAEFKTAYAAGTLIKLANRPLNQVLLNNDNGVDWASLVKSPNPTGVNTGRGSATRLNSNIAAPQVHEPGGKRFLLEEGHVDYLGWSFNIGHTPISGLKLFNVRYRGDSVAYEIGLSEAIAVYSGVQDIVQAATVYGDTAWGLGASANEQVRGVDCPSTGVMMDVSFLYDAGEATHSVNTICVFEQVAQAPLRRHSNGGDYAGLAAHHLVVRIVLPVYNYDYVFDHIFHLNGAIELRGSTSGYLQSTFWSPELSAEHKKFGMRIGPFTAGTTHDHVLNFKIDMDVKGTANSLVKATTKAVKAVPSDINGKKYRLSNFNVAPDYMTKKTDFNTVQTEGGFDLMHGTMFQVVAAKGKNKWDDRRQGYRLKLNGAIENAVAHTSSMRAYSFSKNTFAATVRHEDEPTVSSIYDQSDTTGTIMKSVTPGGVARPHVDMDRFLANKEYLPGSDLVLWVNVGVQHHTHAEDIPVTTTNGNTVNIWLLPMNLYDYDDSMDVGNALYAAAESPMDYFDLKQDSADLCPMTYDMPGEGFGPQATPPPL